MIQLAPRVHFISSPASDSDMAAIAAKMPAFSNRSDVIRFALAAVAQTLTRTGALPVLSAVEMTQHD